MHVGRYRGHTVKWIIHNRPSYALWASRNRIGNFPELSPIETYFCKMQCLRMNNMKADIEDWRSNVNYDARPPFQYSDNGWETTEGVPW